MTPTRTPFAGYERLAPGDPLSSDDYAFTFINPVIADLLARIGAVTHRHDAHAAMADPVAAPVLTVSDAGGVIAASQPIYVAYTLLDGSGGETLPVVADVLTTPAGYATPAGAPAAAVDHVAGALLAGNFSYAVTVADGAGGETPIGPAALATIDPGYAHSEVTLTGLAAILADSSGGALGATWRLWRAKDGGDWYLIGSGTGDTLVDDGIAGDCSVAPPLASTTRGTCSFGVTVPGAGQPAAAVSFNLYVSIDGSFANPALLANYPVSEFDVAKVFADLAVSDGTPPARSRCFPGANKIDPDTDILDYPWKRPVATFADLPALGNDDGDMRIVLATHVLYVWDGAAWDPGGGATGATGARGSLWYTGHGAPGAIGGQLNDDMYLDVDTGDYYQLAGGVWTLEGTIGGGGGGALRAGTRAHLVAATNTGPAGWNKVPIDTVDFDTAACWDAGNHRYVAPAAGEYQVSGQVEVQANENMAVALYKNGARIASGGSGQPTAGFTGSVVLDLMALAPGDDVELWYYCATPGVALNVDGTCCFLTVKPLFS